MSPWTPFLPRVILAVILLAIVSLGIDPAIHWSLTNSVESASGSEFSIYDVNTDFGHGAAVIRQLQIVDASDPSSPVMNVDEAVLQLDRWELAKRRLVIKDGELRGIRINADVGRVDCSRPATKLALAREAATLGNAWQRVVERQKLESEQTQSAQLARQIQEQRSQQFQSLMRQATDWQDRFNELDELTQYIGDNPLRMTSVYRARLEQLASVGLEVQQLNNQLTSLQRQTQEDQMALDQARKVDLAALRNDMLLTPVSHEQLSKYLLEDEWATRIGSWVNWLRSSRKVVDLRLSRPQFVFTNARGVDLLLNAGRKSDFEVQSLGLQGSGQVDGQVFRFHGTLEHLSDEPSRALRPTALTLTAEGSGAIQMDAVLDRSSDVPRDRFRVVCPGLPAPRKIWGDPQEFAVESGPSTLRLALHVQVEKDQLQGWIEFTQSNASLAPKWPGSCCEDVANQAMYAALQEVRLVTGAVELTGTLRHPVWHLESDLGEQVVSCMQDVMRDELSQRTDLLVQQYQRQAAPQVAQVVESLRQQEQAAVAQLSAKATELNRLRSRIAQRTDLMDQLVRNAGPLENLLR